MNMKYSLEDNPLLFLISSPRSGSSMLRNKLNDFSQIMALPSDTRMVEFMAKNIQLVESDFHSFKEKFKSAYKKRIFTFFTETDWETFMSNEISSLDEMIKVCGLLTTKRGDKTLSSDTFFVEKSPNNIYYLEFIRKTFPKAKIIYLVRDPRDVVNSLNSKFWSSHNTFYNAKRWNFEQRLIEESYDFKIQYEKLVENSSEVLVKFLADIEYPNLLEVDELFRVDAEKPKNTPETDQSIHRGNKQKFKSGLSRIDREQEIIEFCCKHKMIELGYELTASNYDHRFYRKLFFLSIEHYTNRLIKILTRFAEY